MSTWYNTRQRRKGLSSFDDKRYLLDPIRSVPFGYQGASPPELSYYGASSDFFLNSEDSEMIDLLVKMSGQNEDEEMLDLLVEMSENAAADDHGRQHIGANRCSCTTCLNGAPDPPSPRLILSRSFLSSHRVREKYE